MKVRAWISAQIWEGDVPIADRTFKIDAALAGAHLIGEAVTYGEPSVRVPIDVDAEALRPVLGPLGLELPVPTTE